MKKLSLFAACLFLAFVAMPMTGQAGELVVQTKANALEAYGCPFATPPPPTEAPSVLISVVVTKKGKPVERLGESEEGLPPQWTLESTFNNPLYDPENPDSVSSCPLVANSVVKHGNGIYTLEVEPECGSWAPGDYHYAVRVKVGGWRGMGLGVLTIPGVSPCYFIQPPT
jgi:hypothetical protein